MGNLGNGNSKFLVGGSIGGFLCGIDLLYSSASFIELAVKFAGLLAAGFITGFCTVLGNDFYKLKVKNKLFKTKTKKDVDTGTDQRVA